ncbi:N-6 DNA methylase [Cellvibrio sp. NN19]|uniref:N-6 DNA methylase n=1 Tax=Cellvibrio chitinivorans TaxID=3102792 RepID=UPI002B404F2C|nr:N-6 DNA methylase [Cellvibrio sp. NN19]
MENSKELMLQNYIWDYANIVRSTGVSFDHAAVGAFLTILAFHGKNIRLNHADQKHYLGDFIRKVVDDFTRDFSNINYDYIKAFDILYEHPALHRLVCQVQHERVTETHLISVLYWIASQSSFDLNSTPDGVALTMVRLLKVEPSDVVLDPAMGSGSFLKALTNVSQSIPKFTGIEINTNSYFIAVLYSLLINANQHLLFNLNFFDILDRDFKSKFDVILCNPPVSRMSKNDETYRYRDGLYNYRFTNEVSLNFIELGLNLLKPLGKAAYLVNVGQLFNQGDAKLVRKSWIERKLLKLVISLPSKLLRHTSLKCAILIFENSNDNHNQIKFVNADDCFIEIKRGGRLIDEPSIDEILQRARVTNDGIRAKIIPIQTIIENDFNLVPDEYLDHELQGTNFNLAKIWKPLSDLAEIIRGSSLAQTPIGEDPIIQGRDVRVECIDIDSLEKRDITKYLKQIQRTQAYDILLQRIGDSPAAYCVKPGEEGIAVSDTLFIIRFKLIDTKLIEFITQFINSEQGVRAFSNASHHSVVQTQSLAKIKPIKVPVPESNIIALIQEMNEIELALKNEYEKASQLRVSIFGGANEADLSVNFNQIRLTAHALESALAQKDDIQYKIKNLYPFPLAYAYRNIYVEREHAAIYDRQMKYGEHFLSFMASVGLSLVKKHVDEINEPLNQLNAAFNVENLQKGMSPGHWRTVFQSCCSLLRTLDSSPLAADFSSIWFKGAGKKESDFASATTDKIVKILNDFKHGRGPVNSYEYREAGAVQKNTLNFMLASVEFLTQWNFILIEDIDMNLKSGKPIYTVSLLKGDHPAFESKKFEASASLSKGKVYISYGDEFICLYPYISLFYNKATRRQELFTLDRKNSGNSFSLKSFDSGTTITESLDLELEAFLQ